MFFYSIDKEATSKTKTDSQILKRTKSAKELFPRADEIDSRVLFFSTKIAFDRRLKWLAKNLNVIKSHLQELRAGLVDTYVAFESKMPIDTWVPSTEQHVSGWYTAVGYVGYVQLGARGGGHIFLNFSQRIVILLRLNLS